MEILILNGSPRPKGNTATAIAELVRGIDQSTHHVQVVDVTNKNIKGCMGCGACHKNNSNCIIQDDAVAITQQMADADLIVFATPVYFWGMTGQLKTLLDRFYAKGGIIRNQKKAIGAIVIGGAVESNPQYQLMKQQFTLFCEYLHWDLAFYCPIAASAIGDLQKNTSALATLFSTGQNL